MIRLPILTYHSIDPSGSVLSTSPELFQRQIEFLAAEEYRTLTLSEAAALLRGDKSLSRAAVVLTFDDGFRSVHEHALPLMKKYELRGTLFVVTDYCGRDNDWPDQPKEIPRLPLLSTEEIRDLVASGWEIGAHSATHARLTSLEDGDLENELERCWKRLSEITVSPVEWFAYPYGSHDSRVRMKVGIFFKGACSTKLAYATPASDPFALERIDAYYLRNHRFYRSLHSKWLAQYLRFRRVLRKARGQ